MFQLHDDTRAGRAVFQYGAAAQKGGKALCTKEVRKLLSVAFNGEKYSDVGIINRQGRYRSLPVVILDIKAAEIIVCAVAFKKAGNTAGKGGVRLNEPAKDRFRSPCVFLNSFRSTLLSPFTVIR